MGKKNQCPTAHSWPSGRKRLQWRLGAVTGLAGPSAFGDHVRPHRQTSIDFSVLEEMINLRERARDILTHGNTTGVPSSVDRNRYLEYCKRDIGNPILGSQQGPGASKDLGGFFHFSFQIRTRELGGSHITVVGPRDLA